MSARKAQADQRKALRVAKTVKRLEGASFNKAPSRRAPSHRRTIGAKMATSPGGGIAARSGATPGSATCVFEDHGTGSAATGSSFTVFNYYTAAVGASKKIYVHWVDGHWEVLTEQC